MGKFGVELCEVHVNERTLVVLLQTVVGLLLFAGRFHRGLFVDPIGLAQLQLERSVKGQTVHVLEVTT